MVSTNIEHLRVLDQLPHLGLLQVLNLVQVCSCKIGAQRAVVACDDDTATACGGLIVVAVFGAHAGVGGDLLEGLTVAVAADAADVDGGGGGKDVLEQSVSISRLCTHSIVCGVAIGVA
jgi:hypothetical protein